MILQTMQGQAFDRYLRCIVLQRKKPDEQRVYTQHDISCQCDELVTRTVYLNVWLKIHINNDHYEILAFFIVKDVRHW